MHAAKSVLTYGGPFLSVEMAALGTLKNGREILETVVQNQASM